MPKQDNSINIPKKDIGDIEDEYDNGTQGTNKGDKPKYKKYWLEVNGMLLDLYPVKIIKKTERYSSQKDAMEYGIIFNPNIDEMNPIKNLYAWFNTEEQRTVKLDDIKEKLALMGIVII